MIMLILLLGFALVVLLIAIAAYIGVRSYSLLQDCQHAKDVHAANHAYVSELRTRQLKSMDKTDMPERNLTVLHFPHPPGAA